ncbi:flagellar biosynthetic protein FliP, partial [Serratia proteamaculans]
MTHTQQSASPTMTPLGSDWQKTAVFPLSCWEWAGVRGKQLLAAALLLISPAAFAQLPGLISQPLANGGQSWSLPVQTLVLLTSLSFLPAMLLMMTSFTRIIIV